jgi:hypothetical protein
VSKISKAPKQVSEFLSKKRIDVAGLATTSIIKVEEPKRLWYLLSFAKIPIFSKHRISVRNRVVDFPPTTLATDEGERRCAS